MVSFYFVRSHSLMVCHFWFRLTRCLMLGTPALQFTTNSIRRSYSSEKKLYQISTIPISKKMYPSLKESLSLLNSTTSKLRKPQDLEIFKRSKKIFENDQSKFINTHFSNVSNALSFLVRTPTVVRNGARYDYLALSEHQLKVIITRTTSQTELIHIFDNLMSAGKLTRPILIPLLLNKNLIDRQAINRILINVLIASSSATNEKSNRSDSNVTTMQQVGKLNNKGASQSSSLLESHKYVPGNGFSSFAKWSKCDFICLQVALTQKFFMSKDMPFVNELINLNFQNSWIPYIVNSGRSKEDTLLPESIERSIFRIFFIFIKDEQYLKEEIIPNLGNRSFFLLLEAMPLKYIKESPPEKLKEFISQMTESLTNLTDLQLLYLDLLRLNVSHYHRFNSLKLISIESKLSNVEMLQDEVLRNLANNRHSIDDSNSKILHLKNPLSLLLSSSMQPEEEKNLVKAKVQLTDKESKLLKTYRHLLDSIALFIIDECSTLPVNNVHETKAILDTMKIRFKNLSTRLGSG